MSTEQPIRLHIFLLRLIILSKFTQKYPLQSTSTGHPDEKSR